MKQLLYRIVYLFGELIGLMYYIVLPVLWNIMVFPVYLIVKLDTYLWFKRIGNDELNRRA